MAAGWTTCPQCKILFQPEAGASAPLCPGCRGAARKNAAPTPAPRWFYAKDRRKVGPVTMEQLKQLAAEGALGSGDMVLGEGTTTWAPAGSVPGLFDGSSGETVDDPGRTGSYASASLAAARSLAGSAKGSFPALPGYEVLEELGRGGMGVVYKARQVGLGRLVAVKMIRAVGSSGEERARFRTEAQAVARLQHPHIVQIHEIGEHQGLPFFSLEYVEGGTLAGRLGGTPLPAREAAQLLAVLASAIEAAHQRGIVHRDLKPANVLLAGPPGAAPAQCTPKIADFGLAKQLDADVAQTQTGAIMGTPSYMAPEQAAGQTGAIGPATDVYALGAILYELLTGRPPFRAASVLETLEQVRTQEPVAPRALQPGVPRDLETICLKCLRKEPAQRYASARELAEDLGRLLRNEPILARPPGLVERLVKLSQRNKLLVASTVAIFLVLLAGIVATSVQARRARKAEQASRSQLLESLVGESQRALQRGRLREAIAACDQALDLGYADPTELRLRRIRALIRLNETDRARQELEPILKQGAGPHEASALMFRGYLFLGQNTEEGLGYFRQAVEKKLPPADEAFARGILSETSPEAIRAFEEAVRLDNDHYEARSMLGMCQILLGKLEDAERTASSSNAIYPNDPGFMIMLAILRALGGDLGQAQQWVERARPQLPARQIEALKVVMEVLHEVHGWDGLFDPDTAAKMTRAATLMAPHLPSLLSEEVKPDAASPIGSTVQSWLRMPPLFNRSHADTIKVLSRVILAGGKQDILAELDQALKANPEGTLMYFKGINLLGLDRVDEAEQVFIEAAAAPSFLRIRRAALLAAIQCGGLLMQRQGGAGPDLRQRLDDGIKALYRGGPVKPSEYEVLAAVAVNARLHDLSRFLLGEWQEKADDIALPLRARMKMEVAAGDHLAALQAARRLLQLEATDREAQEVSQLCLEKLRQGVRP